jgi:hypothetical protein
MDIGSSDQGTKALMKIEDLPTPCLILDRQILEEVRGRQGDQDRDADDKNKFKPSIQERVNGVAGEIGDVTSPPTQLQRESLESAMKDLEAQVTRLNAILTTRVPALNRALDAAGVPWTVGRPIRQ